MKRVLCILENGFEEIEAIATVDLLRRAGIEVLMAGVNGIEITGKCDVRILADDLLDNVSGGEFDALFLPGGPAVKALRKLAGLTDQIRKFHSEGKVIAAICAAPLLLHDAGLLEGRTFTSHFSTKDELPTSTGSKIENDGNLLTSRGAGTAVDFGLALVDILRGRSVADEVASSIMV